MSKILDKARFTRLIPCSALQVPNPLVDKVQKLLRQSELLLNISKIRHVVENPDDQSVRFILLRESDPLKASEHIDQGIKAILNTDQVICRPYQCQVSYDQLSVDEVLEQVLPSGSEIPSSFEQVGHIAHLNLREEQLPYKEIIAQVFLDKNPNIKTIVNKTSNISNEFRVFPMEILAGDPNLETVVREEGNSFELNFGQVYWNSRLQHEHKRLVSLVPAAETICDMFAGIGPFAIPAAVKGCTVHANDLNPVSYQYLLKNIKRNHVSANVVPYNMDGREFVRLLVRNGVEFHHVFMNLPASAIEFLDVFRNLYPVEPPRLPTIHCYCFTAHPETDTDVRTRVENVLGVSLTSYSLYDVRNVAPKKEMMCISFQLPAECAVVSGKQMAATAARPSSSDVDADAEPTAKRVHVS